MISVIVYGRNDVHGYNAHRRVALSLNCMAEVLTDPDDEIVFVDYNTPDELPTLIEALADTLTGRCLSLLRVLRVREAIHRRRYAAHTHLAIVEPVARNVAARRSNPENRWLLSTTTDMVLVPLSGHSLTQTCADLPDGSYGLPRFELPEWLWERLPRSDAQRAIAEIARLGPALRLDEITTSHEEMGFDAPGDFQLVLREDFFAIDGFDEAMLLGWHVDTNLSKRLYMRRGSIESLESVVAGYHCNHNRTATVYHGTPLANDLRQFFYEIEQPDLPGQRETWGLATESVEPVTVGAPADDEFTSAVLDASQGGAAPPKRFDATEARFALEYDSRHALPYVADAMRTARRNARVAYVGANPALRQRLAKVVAGWTDGELLVPEPGDRTSLEQAAAAADIVVVDLGVDAGSFGSPLARGSGPEYTLARQALVGAFDELRQLVDLERARLEQGSPQRRFVLVNSASLFWDAFVLANMHCGATTPHARVRTAIVRSEPDRSDDALLAEEFAIRLRRWISRDDSPRGRVRLDPDDGVSIDELTDYSGFGEGWAYPDWDGIWTTGVRSDLIVDLGKGSRGGIALSLGFDAIGVQPPEELAVTVRVNDADFETRIFTEADTTSDSPVPTPARGRAHNALAAIARRARSAGVPGVDATIAAVRRARKREPEERFSWDIRLTEDLNCNGTLALTFVLNEPVAWRDDRCFGLHLRSLKIARD